MIDITYIQFGVAHPRAWLLTKIRVSESVETLRAFHVCSAIGEVLSGSSPARKETHCRTNPRVSQRAALLGVNQRAARVRSRIFGSPAELRKTALLLTRRTLTRRGFAATEKGRRGLRPPRAKEDQYEQSRNSRPARQVKAPSPGRHFGIRRQARLSRAAVMLFRWRTAHGLRPPPCSAFPRLLPCWN